jgi:pyruvate,water dikinase
VSEAERRRFSITDAEMEELAGYRNHRASLWASDGYRVGRDGADGKLYILQARPETVKANDKLTSQKRYRLKERSEIMVHGRSIGNRVGMGPVRRVMDASEMPLVQPGDVLVTDMTDPDWEPVMKKAAAIVTNRGGRTCHAAIIARELGIPAGRLGDATRQLPEGEQVTVSCGG